MWSNVSRLSQFRSLTTLFPFCHFRFHLSAMVSLIRGQQNPNLEILCCSLSRPTPTRSRAVLPIPSPKARSLPYTILTPSKIQLHISGVVSAQVQGIGLPSHLTPQNYASPDFMESLSVGCLFRMDKEKCVTSVCAPSSGTTHKHYIPPISRRLEEGWKKGRKEIARSITRERTAHSEC